MLFLQKSFNSMYQSSKVEYMKLYDKYSDTSNVQSKVLKARLDNWANNVNKWVRATNLDKDEQNNLIKIVNIYFSNAFASGVRIKSSRFNHSCRPNAYSVKIDDCFEIVASSDIKAGEEITISLREECAFGLPWRQERQKILFLHLQTHFLCMCDLCQEQEGEDCKHRYFYDQKTQADDDLLEIRDLLEEADDLEKSRQAAWQEEDTEKGKKLYTLSKAKRLVDCYTELYKRGNLS